MIYQPKGIRRIWTSIYAAMRGLFVKERPVESIVFPPKPEKAGLRDALKIRDVLDKLPKYFDDLKALRKVDEEAYQIFSKLGGVVAPEQSLLLTTQTVPERIVKNPPTIRCVFVTPDHKCGKDSERVPVSIIYMMRMGGGKVVVNRFGGNVVLPEGICYRFAIVWMLDGNPFCGDCYIHIDENGRVTVIKENIFLYQTIQSHGGRKGGRSSNNKSRFMKKITSAPLWINELGKDLKRDKFEILSEMVNICLSSERPKRSILVRALQGNAAATFTIDKRDAKRFFKDRDTGLAIDGKRKRVLHFVGSFDRDVNGENQHVRSHYRGERSFDWKGYAIQISGLGFHHADFFDAPIEQFDQDDCPKGAMISLRKASKMIVGHYLQPRFLSKTS